MLNLLWFHWNYWIKGTCLTCICGMGWILGSFFSFHLENEYQPCDRVLAAEMVRPIGVSHVMGTIWLRWWHSCGLSHLQEVLQQRPQGPRGLSQMCLHVHCFSSPHTMFSLWPHYGQSHFLKKLVLCKCAPLPHPTLILSLCFPDCFLIQVKRLRRPPHSA